jgi:hypothetical protein
MGKVLGDITGQSLGCICQAVCGKVFALGWECQIQNASSHHSHRHPHRLARFHAQHRRVRSIQETANFSIRKSWIHMGRIGTPFSSIDHIVSLI